MLLYCTANYGKYFMQIPGLGVVLRSDQRHIEYRWLPFVEPLSKTILDQHLDPGDASKMKNIWMTSHWLFEISERSFLSVVGERSVAWRGL